VTKTTYFLAEAAIRRNYQDLRFCPQDIAEDLAQSKRRSLARLSLKRPDFTVYTGGSEQALTEPYIEDALLPPAFHHLTEGALAVNDEQSVYAAVNVEEHLMLKARGEKEDMEELVARLRALEQDMEDPDHPFARNKRFDYLSYRPVLAGSGLHASFILHLPMLSFLKQIKQLTEAVRKMHGCLLKSFGHVDRQGAANLFLVGNASSQGLSDEQILEHVDACAAYLDRKESLLQQMVFRQKAHSGVLDQAWRAYGILSYTRHLTQNDFLAQWSSLRMGAAAGVFPLPLKEVDSLFSFARNSVFAFEGEDPKNFPFRRADAVRRVLSGG
jgi:protein-arginine kinase